jgi:hypothetical protein
VIASLRGARARIEAGLAGEAGRPTRRYDRSNRRTDGSRVGEVVGLGSGLAAVPARQTRHYDRSNRRTDGSRVGLAGRAS